MRSSRARQKYFQYLESKGKMPKHPEHEDESDSEDYPEHVKMARGGQIITGPNVMDGDFHQTPNERFISDTTRPTSPNDFNEITKLYNFADKSGAPENDYYDPTSRAHTPHPNPSYNGGPYGGETWREEAVRKSKGMARGGFAQALRKARY